MDADNGQLPIVYRGFEEERKYLQRTIQLEAKCILFVTMLFQNIGQILCICLKNQLTINFWSLHSRAYPCINVPPFFARPLNFR